MPELTDSYLRDQLMARRRKLGDEHSPRRAGKKALKIY